MPDEVQHEGEPHPSEVGQPPAPKSNAGTIIVVLLLAVVTFAAALVWMFWPTWKEYASREGNFGVEMPGEPAPHIREVEVNGLPGKTRFSTMELEESDGDLFGVAYTDIPPEVEFKPDELLEKLNMANLAGMISTKLTTLPRGPTTFRGFPGRDYTITVPDGTIFARVLLVKRRIYLLVVMGEEVRPDREDVQRFMTSFDFVDDPK